MQPNFLIGSTEDRHVQGTTTNNPPRDTVFYDGHCGFCHGAVRFVLAIDRNAIFRFAPLQGRLFTELFSETERQRIPDSIVVCDEDGNLFFYSSAIVYILRRVGGIWNVVGWLLWLIPPFLRNPGYRWVARVRRRLTKRPDDLCPIVPKHLRSRFHS